MVEGGRWLGTGQIGSGKVSSGQPKLEIYLNIHGMGMFFLFFVLQIFFATS